MLWFGLESNSNSNLANTLFTACFWQMNWAFSETMPNALLPLGWMLKTKLTLLCLVLLLVSHVFILYCFLFYFVDSVFFCVCFRCAVSQKSVIFCLSFYRKYLFICHLFWNRSTVNLILFNKQMLCLLLWVIVISSGRCMYVRRICHLYIHPNVYICVSFNFVHLYGCHLSSGTRPK